MEPTLTLAKRPLSLTIRLSEHSAFADAKPDSAFSTRTSQILHSMYSRSSSSSSADRISIVSALNCHPYFSSLFHEPVAIKASFSFTLSILPSKRKCRPSSLMTDMTVYLFFSLRKTIFSTLHVSVFMSGVDSVFCMF